MPDNTRRFFLVEFLSLVALVVLAGAANLTLTITGHGDAQGASALLDIVKIGFGAIVALAYAARGAMPPTTTTTASVTTTATTPTPTTGGKS